ncbi:hypothetical protein DQ04_02461000 [Trypanosoma grayi]|uniref:hypothetical protein n=1 Tax=Trypanosoma grayi TaxID=71804 RepID=UPI0004F3FE15|nr:hypothetical protein DQ04_02461000 [Trypanosoma grayi]KEG11585.1 hypothetical protein DQ04_02461000 [Trypanosoma grayi]
MSLIVAGATGAIGRCVVREALRRAEITRVVALTRSTAVSDPAALFNFTVLSDAAEATNNNNSSSSTTDAVTPEQLRRLIPVTFDWEKFCGFWTQREAGGAATDVQYVGGSYESAEAYYRDLFGGHAYAAMCLGTTRHDAGSAAAFEHCDYDYVVNFAKAVRAFSGDTVATYAQVSAQLADKNSWLLYNKTKGRADAAVEALQFPRCCIYRPGLLNRGAKTRTVEKVAQWFVRGIPVETCGRAILRDMLFCSKRSSSDAAIPPCECAGKAESTPSTGTQVIIFANSAIQKEAADLK